MRRTGGATATGFKSSSSLPRQAPQKRYLGRMSTSAPLLPRVASNTKRAHATHARVRRAYARAKPRGAHCWLLSPPGPIEHITPCTRVRFNASSRKAPGLGELGSQWPAAEPRGEPCFVACSLGTAAAVAHGAQGVY